MSERLYADIALFISAVDEGPPERPSLRNAGSEVRGLLVAEADEVEADADAWRSVHMGAVDGGGAVASRAGAGGCESVCDWMWAGAEAGTGAVGRSGRI